MKNLRTFLGSWAVGLALVAQTPLAPPRLDTATPTPVNATVPDDPELAKVLAPYSDEIHKSFGRVIAHLPEEIGRPRDRKAVGLFPLGYFLADIMREGAAKASGREIRFGFTNSGGLRRNLPAGDLRVQDIYEVMPFENELVIAEYTGQEIMQIVKEGIKRRGGEPCSGILASVTGDPKHPDVKITWSDGTAIDPAATYLAATTDYLLANGDGVPTLKNGRNVQLTGVPLRQLIIDTCEAKGKAGKDVVAPRVNRYTLSAEVVEAIRSQSLNL
ncbi:5'-nucleotidase C-terminal domain-containing protein [Mesoterricola sediminis]|uniref:5'-Nucleotidase C-terminal domain-containing protein n=1 Tax=Mesoterricola sediminis TaxID=2927980 RepID=A0AA48KDJ9_9BACT|nr:5'-nucleotidase C-terminal domain-containing protein [Mesoterricola sediminis]BDU77150.1 hypothetical protein METESE_21080 [Mesoterricola sediminis]